MTKATKAPKADPEIRPGAGGHRFGPDLQCNECGRNWDEHQHDPSPCSEAADSDPSAPVVAIDAGHTGGSRDEAESAFAEPGGDASGDDAGDDDF